MHIQMENVLMKTHSMFCRNTLCILCDFKTCIFREDTKIIFFPVNYVMLHEKTEKGFESRVSLNIERVYSPLKMSLKRPSHQLFEVAKICLNSSV